MKCRLVVLLILALLSVREVLANSISDVFLVSGKVTLSGGNAKVTLEEGSEPFVIDVPTKGLPLKVAVELLEPDGTTMSDVIFTQSFQGKDVITFCSDPIPKECGIPAGYTIKKAPETGTIQNIGAFFMASPEDIRIKSDMNVVPEPSTWLMLGTGFIGIGGMVRRKLGI